MQESNRLFCWTKCVLISSFTLSSERHIPYGWIQGAFLLGEQRTEVHASTQVFPRSRGVVTHLDTGVSLRAGNRQCWVGLPRQAQPVPLTSSRWGGDCLWCMRYPKRVVQLKRNQIRFLKLRQLNYSVWTVFACKGAECLESLVQIFCKLKYYLLEEICE